MASPTLMARFKAPLKRLAARLLRPGLLPIDERLARVEAQLGVSANSAPKYQAELAFWRTLIKEGGSQARMGEPFEVVFGRWQRDRLLSLADYLGLPAPDAIDEWCRQRSVVEIGAGPYPAIAAARLGWRRAVAVDPLAKGYADEGMLPEVCRPLVYLEAPGEAVPLPAHFADLVVIENCLDHVSDPQAVVREIHRLLVPGGLVWLFVDLSNYADYLHPHPMSESRLKGLMIEFELVRGQVTPNKAHPEAYAGYRGLWRKPVHAVPAESGPAASQAPQVHVVAGTNGAVPSSQRVAAS